MLLYDSQLMLNFHFISFITNPQWAYLSLKLRIVEKCIFSSPYNDPKSNLKVETSIFWEFFCPCASPLCNQHQDTQ